jgi:hypothetical protein
MQDPAVVFEPVAKQHEDLTSCVYEFTQLSLSMSDNIKRMGALRTEERYIWFVIKD